MTEAEDKIYKTIRNSLKPNGNINILEWVKKNVYASHSPKGKNVDLELTPYFKEPFLQILKNPTLKECSICSPVGSGKSTMLIALATVTVALYPKQLMFVGQNEQQTTDFLDLHLKPCLKKNKDIFNMWPKRQMDRKESIHFPTMSIYTGQATAINTLQSRSIDLQCLDEVWLYPAKIIDEARGRLHSRPGARMVLVSQGSYLNDEFHRNYSLGQIKKYAWLCPSCETRNIYNFEDLKFEYQKDDKEQPIYTSVKAHLQCPCCEHQIQDTIENRRSLSEGAIYVVEDEKQNHLPDHYSYNLNQLAVYDVKWTDLAREFLVSNSSLNKAHSIRQFFQKKMGEFFDESKYIQGFDVTENISGYQMDEFKNEQWDVRIMTADVQGQLIWVAIRDWTREGKSRLVAYKYCSTFTDLEKIRIDYSVKPKAVFVDCAFKDAEVKAACCNYGWIGINGREDRLYSVKNSKGKTIERVFSMPKRAEIKTPTGMKTCQIVHYAGTSVKDILTTLMKKNDMWEIPSGGDQFDQYLHQLQSEDRRINQKTGKPYYHKVREQNHAFDVETEQIVAAMIWKCLIFSEDEVESET